MTLQPHQQQMVEWILAHPRCAVWARMGAGKTLATLVALSVLALVEDGPVLVVSTKRVAEHTWPEEVRKWRHLGLTCEAMVGSARDREVAMSYPADIYTINFESLPWLIEWWGDAWPYRTVVIDESTKLKGFRTRQGTKRSKALARLAFTKITRLIELTGTPAPNGLLDLWGQLWFIDRGQRLGNTYTAFTDRWFIAGWGGFGHTPMPSAQREIEARCADVCLTVEPPYRVDEPVVTDILVDLPAGVRKLYRDLEREMFAELSATAKVTAVNAAALTMKCQQLANGEVYLEKGGRAHVHDAKLDALESVVEEAAGMPVLVAYSFVSDRERILRRFPQARVLDTPADIDDWNAGRIPVALIHPQSAGHGLNLQHGGNIIVWFGVTWNLEHYLQAIERIGPLRQKQAGYDRPCLVYRILARDTVDEQMTAVLAGKGTVQEALMDAMKRRGR